jgi:cytoskeleton protein RodZ
MRLAGQRLRHETNNLDDMNKPLSDNDSHKDDKAASEKTEKKVDFGTELSEARKAGNYTVEDINLHTKIPVHTISVIEANDIEALPPPTFTRGYIRAYAKFLEISEDKVLEKYDQAVPRHQTRELKPRSNLPNEASSQSPLVKVITMLLIVAGVAAVIFGSFKYYQEKAGVIEDALDSKELSFTGNSLDSPGSSGSFIEQEASSTRGKGLVAGKSDAYESSVATEVDRGQESDLDDVDSSQTDVVEDTVSANETDTTLSTEARENDIIEIFAENGSWMEVRDANKSRLFYNMVPVGGRKVIVGKAPFSITMGNAKTTRLIINDIEVDISKYISPKNTAKFRISTDGQDIIFH